VKEPATENPSPRPSVLQAKEEETMPESSTTNVGESPYGKRPQRPGPKPGTRLANGKRVPPPPAPKGTIIPKRKESNSAEPINESLRLFDAEIKLGTRPACEKAIERIVNWIKAGKVNANDGNAMVNGIRAVIMSKTTTEELRLKVVDKELLRRFEEVEQITEQLIGLAAARGDKVH
jgi:hypothetical protein